MKEYLLIQKRAKIKKKRDILAILKIDGEKFKEEMIKGMTKGLVRYIKKEDQYYLYNNGSKEPEIKISLGPKGRVDVFGNKGSIEYRKIHFPLVGELLGWKKYKKVETPLKEG